MVTLNANVTIVTGVSQHFGAVSQNEERTDTETFPIPKVTGRGFVEMQPTFTRRVWLANKPCRGFIFEPIGPYF